MTPFLLVLLLASSIPAFDLGNSAEIAARASAATIAIPDVDKRFPLPMGLVCYDGHLYERVSLSGDGKAPFARRPAGPLTAPQAKAWENCGDMTILGSFAMLAAGNYADMLSTELALGGGGAAEANPIFGNPTEEPLRFVAIKSTIIAAELFLVHVILEPRNPKLAKWVRRFLVAGNAGISAWNIRVLSQTTLKEATP